MPEPRLNTIRRAAHALLHGHEWESGDLHGLAAALGVDPATVESLQE